MEHCLISPGKYSAMSQLMREDYTSTNIKYPPLSMARCSFIQQRELSQCRVKKLPKVSHGITRFEPGFVVESWTLQPLHQMLSFKNYFKKITDNDI